MAHEQASSPIQSSDDGDQQETPATSPSSPFDAQAWALKAKEWLKDEEKLVVVEAVV